MHVYATLQGDKIFTGLGYINNAASVLSETGTDDLS
jgi:hypothetical protein